MDGDREAQRQRYRPDPIRVLFIGESPPAGGTFFYAADSVLYRWTREAFSRVWTDCGHGEKFLQFFKDRGCYLDDLCREPVNELGGATRRQKREAGIEPLADRLRADPPQAVVVIMEGICTQVVRVVQQARVIPAPRMYILPFPSRHQRRYVDGLVQTLEELTGAGILLGPTRKYNRGEGGGIADSGPEGGERVRP